MIRIPTLTCFLALAFAAPMAAQEGVAFSPAATEFCLDDGGADECIGLAAEACMERSEGGYSTYGMGQCLSRELEYWDAMLNANYRDLMAKEKAFDAERESGGGTPVKLADRLRDMQRAWIVYRDAACDYEYALWDGGTGGGPARLSCLMQLTGEQALKLAFMRSDV